MPQLFLLLLLSISGLAQSDASPHLMSLRVTVPEINKKGAGTQVQGYFGGVEVDDRTYRVKASIYDPRGQKINTVHADYVLANDSIEYRITMTRLEQPLFWSPDRPSLYTMTVRLMEGDRVIDTLTSRYGYRSYDIMPGGPFVLNGDTLPIRGVTYATDHGDNAVYGQELEALKEAGINFLKLEGAAQIPAVYELCDELGLMLWDGLDRHDEREVTERRLAQSINSRYNYPSIFFWSLGGAPSRAEAALPEGDLDIRIESLDLTANRNDYYRLTVVSDYPQASFYADVYAPTLSMPQDTMAFAKLLRREQREQILYLPLVEITDAAAVPDLLETFDRLKGLTGVVLTPPTDREAEGTDWLFNRDGESTEVLQSIERHWSGAPQ